MKKDQKIGTIVNLFVGGPTAVVGPGSVVKELKAIQLKGQCLFLKQPFNRLQNRISTNSIYLMTLLTAVITHLDVINQNYSIIDRQSQKSMN